MDFWAQKRGIFDGLLVPEWRLARCNQHHNNTHTQPRAPTPTTTTQQHAQQSSPKPSYKTIMLPLTHGSRRSRRIAGENAPELAGLPTVTTAAPRRRATTQALDIAEHLPPAEILEGGRKFLEETAVSKTTGTNYKLSVARVQAWLDKADEAASYRDGLNRCDESSEEACFMWLSHHAQEMRYGFLSAHHSALAKHFQVKHHCSANKAGGWFQDGQGKWRGNPVYSERYQQMLKGAQRKDASAHLPVKHSLPMLYPTLEKLLLALEAKRAKFDEHTNEISPERTHTEFICCFMVMAYRLWLRCDEACNLTWGEIDPEAVCPETGSRYVSVRLTWRKTNQFDRNAVSVYQLHYLPGRPKSDAIAAIKRWREYWSWVQHRSPQSDDRVFPGYRAVTGQLELNRILKASDINSMLKKVFDDASIQIAIGDYKYTSHCFRRGGAQDAAIWANNYGEKIKALNFVKWWGGWDAGESTATISRYILNEVAAREDYFGDQENPLKISNRRNLWSGGDSSPVQQAILVFQQSVQRLEQRLEELISQRLESRFSELKELLQDWLGQRPSTLSDRPDPAEVATLSTSSSSSTPLTHQPAAPPAPVQVHDLGVIFEGRPVAQKIPAVTSVKQVIIQWEQGDPANGLLPLREWVPAMRQKGKGGNASIFVNRQKIYKAYARRSHNIRAFEQAYGGPEKKLKDILAQIDDEVKRLRAGGQAV